jgi:hypothetical protein
MYSCRKVMRVLGLCTLSCRLASAKLLAHYVCAGMPQFTCPDGSQCCAQSSQPVLLRAALPVLSLLAVRPQQCTRVSQSGWILMGRAAFCLWADALDRGASKWQSSSWGKATCTLLPCR